MKFLWRFFRFFSRIVLPRIVVIGFDIQDRHIATVASIRKGDKVKPIASSVVELEEDAIENGEIKNFDFVRNGIRKVISQMPAHLFSRLKGEPVFVLSLPPHHLYTETAFFPLMNESELEDAVKLKIETSLPWTLSDAYYDWIRIPITQEGKTAIFITATSRQIVDEYLRVFLEVGWNVSACEFHLLSLAAFINQHTKPFIFILQDEDGVEFSLFHEGKMAAHVLQRLSAQDTVAKIIKDKLKSISVFSESNFSFTPEEVYFCNRISGEIVSFPQEVSVVPIQSFPFPQEVDARFVIAHGASQREYGISETSLNLLPDESSGRFEENLFLKTVSLWSNIFLAFVVTFVLAFGGMWAFVVNEQKKVLGDIVQKRASVEQSLGNSRSVIEDARSFNQLVVLTRESKNLRSHFGNQLTTILSQLEKSGAVFLSARAESDRQITASFSAPSGQNILALKSYLEASGAFSSVTIPAAQLSGDKETTATLFLK